MEDFTRFFGVVLDFFKMPMTVYGFTFSFLGYSPLGLCGLHCNPNYKGAFRWITN